MPLEDIPYLDDRIISRIIDPPRDENGRLKIRPKHTQERLSAWETFRRKWEGYGMPANQIVTAWRDGLRT